MNVFFREMKAHRKALLIWCAGMILMVAGGMGKYAGSVASGQSMNVLIQQMPRSIQIIFGINFFDLAKASGFYGILYMYLILMATIHAVMLGANIISKEERDKTSEFLFVKPLSRSRIISAKLVAALINILVVNLVTLVSSLAIVGSYSKGESVIGDILILMVGMLILQIMFLLIGTGVAAISKRPQVATSVSTAILLVTFILAKITDLANNLEFLKYFTPFKYFEAKDLMYGGRFAPIFLLLSAVLIGAGLYVTYSFYQKRDLNV